MSESKSNKQAWETSSKSMNSIISNLCCVHPRTIETVASYPAVKTWLTWLQDRSLCGNEPSRPWLPCEVGGGRAAWTRSDNGSSLLRKGSQGRGRTWNTENRVRDSALVDRRRFDKRWTSFNSCHWSSIYSRCWAERQSHNAPPSWELSDTQRAERAERWRLKCGDTKHKAKVSPNL